MVVAFAASCLAVPFPLLLGCEEEKEKREIVSTVLGMNVKAQHEELGGNLDSGFFFFLLLRGFFLYGGRAAAGRRYLSRKSHNAAARLNAEAGRGQRGKGKEKSRKTHCVKKSSPFSSPAIESEFPEVFKLGIDFGMMFLFFWESTCFPHLSCPSSCSLPWPSTPPWWLWWSASPWWRWSWWWSTGWSWGASPLQAYGGEKGFFH